jgi:hypothetical protein
VLSRLHVGCYTAALKLSITQSLFMGTVSVFHCGGVSLLSHRCRCLELAVRLLYTFLCRFSRVCPAGVYCACCLLLERGRGLLMCSSAPPWCAFQPAAVFTAAGVFSFPASFLAAFAVDANTIIPSSFFTGRTS